MSFVKTLNLVIAMQWHLPDFFLKYAVIIHCALKWNFTKKSCKIKPCNKKETFLWDFVKILVLVIAIKWHLADLFRNMPPLYTVHWNKISDKTLCIDFQFFLVCLWSLSQINFNMAPISLFFWRVQRKYINISEKILTLTCFYFLLSVQEKLIFKI